ncbi:MAG: peptidoglycan-binding protein [Clostridiales bacterium]|nr:peptidoglycan-binding protein [Clostridiales bacterium]
METRFSRGVGHLQVNVFTQGRARPVERASITIASHGQWDILERLTTGVYGQTEKINLATPPPAFSAEPSEIRPYSLYDLLISAEGYDNVRVEGVQVLPFTTALQDVDLEARATPRTQLITIDDNTLFGAYPPKDPEEETKPLPPGIGYIVLPNPVVPEYVVVHDGTPQNAAAANYHIPFADYIKNVASCEIYASWPEPALEANILAILSFTLNRIYTEWYRSRGYEFNITSSTAYDQAFVYGRNIFAEVSQVVDRLFTSYITKPHIRQPLFAQYCDGQRIQCPGWLSQWGSKALADQGYNSMDILKYYYGYDVHLMQASAVAGIPASFPGRNLQLGSTGPGVRLIQSQLNAIHNNYPALPLVRVDGLFGEDTLAAVTQFQHIFGNNATGTVDFSTWYTISRIYVAVARLAELL